VAIGAVKLQLVTSGRWTVTIQFLAHPCPACRDAPALKVEIEGCGHRPCRGLNWHKNRTQNLLLLPFAASFLCNIRHTSQIWRKRVGVELKPSTPNSRRMMTLQLPPSSNWSQLESASFTFTRNSRSSSWTASLLSFDPCKPGNLRPSTVNTRSISAIARSISLIVTTV
jgi:hypothetical protein